MRRRKVIAPVGQATAAPFIGSGSLHAQIPERMRHIGVLKYTGESDQTSKAGARLRDPTFPAPKFSVYEHRKHRGSWYWAKPWSIPRRQVSCAILAR